MFAADMIWTAAPWKQAFGNITSTVGNHKAFNSNMMQFMDAHNFDGMDLGWEYPTAGMPCIVSHLMIIEYWLCLDDRGGRAEDSVNFVKLSKDIEDTFAKAGRSIFEFRGKDYKVKLNKPLTSKNDRELSANPTKPSVRDHKCTKNKKRAGLRPEKRTNTLWDRPVEVLKREECSFKIGG